MFAFPTPGSARGAASVDYRLVGWTVASFTPSQPGFLAGTPSAYVSAGALINTFSINLDRVYNGTSAPSLLKMVLALGDINATTGSFSVRRPC